jgi:hypothetical protein
MKIPPAEKVFLLSKIYLQKLFSFWIVGKEMNSKEKPK